MSAREEEEPSCFFLFSKCPARDHPSSFKASCGRKIPSELRTKTVKAYDPNSLVSRIRIGQNPEKCWQESRAGKTGAGRSAGKGAGKGCLSFEKTEERHPCQHSCQHTLPCQHSCQHFSGFCPIRILLTKTGSTPPTPLGDRNSDDGVRLRPWF